MSSERQADQTDNPWWGEHLHRYSYAAGIIAPHGKVLDLACGTGFGSHFLAEKGFNVTGVDISEETVAQCKLKYSHRLLEFAVADGTKLPFKDDSFDAVVSFETIEHTTLFREMISEFRRVANKKGCVILSTPNIVVNSPGGIVKNPYHTQEWNYDELNDILKNIFDSIQIYGQQYIRYKNMGLMMSFGRLVENILYMRGIRKLPLRLQDSIMRTITGCPMYPTVKDYGLTDDMNMVRRCKTFVAVCRK